MRALRYEGDLSASRLLRRAICGRWFKECKECKECKELRENACVQAIGGHEKLGVILKS